MSNMATFSALMDWKNRLDRKHTPQRLGYVLNNHIIRGGHLSAQPMGALKDYIAVDPVTERTAVVNFPVCRTICSASTWRRPRRSSTATARS